MDDDEGLRKAIEASMHTAADEAQRNALPSAPPLEQHAEDVQVSSLSSYEQQRREAIARQQARWQTQHHHHHQQQQYHPSDPVDVPLAHYPPIPAAVDEVDRGMQHSVLEETEEERQARLRQEEEDHLLALQLSEVYAREDAEEPDFARTDSDPDWQRVHHPTTATPPSDNTASAVHEGAGDNGSNRSSSHAAAAAGSTAGSLLGAGLSTLMTIAAQAARATRQESTATATATASTDGAQSQSAHVSHGAPQRQQQEWQQEQQQPHQQQQQQQPPSLFNLAARAVGAYLANGAAASSSSSSSSSSHSTSVATPAPATQVPGSSSSRGQQAGQADGNQDVLRVMQQLLGGRSGTVAHPPAPNANGNSGSTGGGGGGMLHLTELPGGLALTYNSGSSTTTSVGGGVFQPQDFHEDDPFAGFASLFQGGPFGGGDPLAELLLSGARRSAAAHHHQASSRGAERRQAGFTHYNPSSGAARFEPAATEGPAGGPMASADFAGLLGALMEGGLFPGLGADGEGVGRLRYEDLVGLDPVHVTTPADVLQGLPTSTFVEGRMPGDSDSCVICQTAYAAGDALMHLPCLHAFHTDCVQPWLEGHSRKCPVCKTDVC